jgi:hypothetical protein
LLGAAQTFDNQVGILSLPSKPVSTQQVAAINSGTFIDFQALQHDDAAVLEGLLHFCYADPEMHNDQFVANFQRYQQNRFPPTRAQLPPTTCLFGPCSRTHPANICCLCRGSHTIGKCYHITGIPESLQPTKNVFAKLHIAKDGPWNPATMISTRPGSNRSAHRSLQGSNQRVATIDVNVNVSDHSGLTTLDAEAVDTVCQDYMEAYCDIQSPILRWNLLHSKTDEPQISSIGLLPQDAPLPALLVAGLAPHRNDDSSYFALFHVDSGATCIVTNQAHELHCPMPSTATCSIALAGARSDIDATGTLALDFITTDKTLIPVELVHAVQITSFQRRSQRPHLGKVNRRKMRLRILTLELSKTAVNKNLLRRNIFYSNFILYELTKHSLERNMCHMLDDCSGIGYSDINCLL